MSQAKRTSHGVLIRSRRREEAEAWSWAPFRLLTSAATHGFMCGRSISLALLFVSTKAFAADVDVSKLPSAATNRIDFTRDIKPIFDASCLKCHGPEKPKSKFRVDDRAELLKGGTEGPAVTLGQSAQSPLIHYVARLVADMEMPPEGKGEPLTAAQVGLLRAWIDQDAPWSGGPAPSKTIAEASPTISWITVKGDERKFRELNWIPEGFNGGLESFRVLEQLDANRRFEITGHALRDDYEVKLSLERTDSLFVRAGFQQFRKYYDDSGGYYAPLGGPLPTLGRDLHLDLGKAWIEAGGITPFGLHLTGGYEFHFKEGEKSLSSWQPTGPVDNPKAILPATKSIDENLHVIRLDAGYDYAGVRFDDNLRYEHYDLGTRNTTTRTLATGTDLSQRIRESDQQHILANAFKAESQLREWLLVSAGYLYSHTDGESAFRMSPVDASGTALAGGPAWNAPSLTLEQSAHVFNANAQLGLWEQMTFSAGAQTEWNRQRVFGAINLDEVDLSFPNGITNNPGRGYGDFDRFTAEEKFTLRNTQIPYTVLYGEARFRQETIRQLEGLNTAEDTTTFNFARDTDVSRLWQLYRAGFQVSPWSRVALNAYYQRRNRDDTFDHNTDTRPYSSGLGYPAFITARETATDEAAAKLVIRPASWLKTTLSYRVISTDYDTKTHSIATFTGGSVQGGQYDAHIHSLNVTLTPWRRFYLSSTFSVQDSRTITADNGNPSIAPFRGQVYSVMTSANYILDNLTDLTLAYDFSHADFTQPNQSAGLPLGIDYQSHGIRAGVARSILKRVKARLEYAWSRYDEPTSAHYNDFTAHGIFATVFVKWD